jgi:6-phosphogluconolactonase (cycloisomerase 2 family)
VIEAAPPCLVIPSRKDVIVTVHPTTGRRTGRLRTLLGTTLGVGVLAVVAPLAISSPASADSSSGAVFVQLNSAAGNAIAAYSRAGDGTLTSAGSYATGGLGGTEASAPVDALASQSGLVLDRDERTLVAVNAGSDSLTSFRTRGAALRRVSLVPSGGQFPSSVAVRDGLVYVLNAGGDGTISGFRLDDGRLAPLSNSTRSLGLGNLNPPLFITAPAQIGFSADGRFLIVTTKLNNLLLTYALGRDGRPATTPVVTASAGPVPFSFVVDPRGTVHVTEAGTGATSSYRVASDGKLWLIASSASDNGAALCWNVRVGKNLYGVNSGSGTLSSWTIGANGAAVLTAPIAATTNAGPIDLAASSDNRTVYVEESFAGTLGAYSVAADGSLTRIQTVTGLPVFNAGGMEGIAAS